MFAQLKRFQYQIPALILLLTLVPLLLFGGLSWHYNRQALSRQVVDNCLTTALRAELKIRTAFANLEQHLTSSLDFVDPAALSAEERGDFLQLVLKNFVEIQDLALLDDQGMELHHLSRSAVFAENDLISHRDDPLVQACLREKKIQWGEISASNLGNMLVAMAMPVVDPFLDRVEQVLLVRVLMRQLLSRLETIKVSGTGVVFAVDRRGRLLFHTDHSLVLSQADFKSNLLVRDFISGQGSDFSGQYPDQAGEPVLGVGVVCTQTGWLVLVEIPTAEAFATLRLQSKLFFSLLLLIVLVGAMLAGYFVFRLVRPLRALESGARKLGSGDFGSRVEVQGENEVTEVARTFNLMAANLQQAAADKEDREWFAQGQVLLDERLRGVEKLADLADLILVFYAQHLGLPAGAVFMALRENVYSCVAAYSLAAEASELPEFNFGEGLVGQVAKERRRLFFSGVSKHHLRLRSALLDQEIDHLELFPLIANDEVVGVIEFGVLGELEARTLRFLEESLSSLSLTLFSARGRQQLEKALAESTRLGSELQGQQEELRVINEELQSQQEELRVANEELETKSQELQINGLEMAQKNEELEKIRVFLEEKSRDLELVSRYKSEFLANMSHELRTPLNSLLLLSQDLQDNRDGNLTTDQVEELGVINSCGHDLLKLINDILDLSKVEAGALKLEIEDVDLHQLADSLADQFRGLAASKQLQYQVVVEEGLTTINSDQQRLGQIIRNLLANAFKFTSQGKVTLRFRPPLAADSPPYGLAIEVIDSGIGIPPERQAEIFEPFKQCDSGTARKFGGTGLGLSISRRLAELLGGEIRLDSEIGRGSTFTLLLPQIVDASQIQSQPPTVTLSRETSLLGPRLNDDRDRLTGEEKIILIVEDDLNFARYLIKLGREKGYACLHAGNAENGLDDARRYQPRAILLDIRLPGMSGLEMLKALRSDKGTASIPVHMMSVDDERIGAFNLGAIGYLLKPVTGDELERLFGRIEDQLAGRLHRLLLIEADGGRCQSLLDLVDRVDLQPVIVNRVEKVLQILDEQSFDCLILDPELPDYEVLIEALSRRDNLPPLLVFTEDSVSKEKEEALLQLAKTVVVQGSSEEARERLLDEIRLFFHDEVEQSPSPVEKQEKTALAGKRILLVDDDMRNVFALSKALQKSAIEVLKAADGRRALALLEEEKGAVDMVLMDIMMPEMDGYEAMRRIRQLPRPLSETPIIALTAKAMREDRERCLQAGANDYLAKPIDLHKLLLMMKVWMKD